MSKRGKIKLYSGVLLFTTGALGISILTGTILDKKHSHKSEVCKFTKTLMDTPLENIGINHQIKRLNEEYSQEFANVRSEYINSDNLYYYEDYYFEDSKILNADGSISFTINPSFDGIYLDYVGVRLNENGEKMVNGKDLNEELFEQKFLAKPTITIDGNILTITVPDNYVLEKIGLEDSKTWQKIKLEKGFETFNQKNDNWEETIGYVEIKEKSVR